MTTKANIIWQTDDVLHNEWDIAKNVELRYDPVSGCTEIRVTRETEGDDPISLAKLLTPFENLEIATALVTAARNQLMQYEEGQ